MTQPSTDANPLFGVETHGFDHIPEADRKMTLGEARFFWVGTNANLFFVAVGAISISLGLSVWQALLACLVGNLLFILVGLAAVAGVRSGLPTVTFTRAVYGIQGNRPHAFLAWVSSVAFEAINTIFGVFATLALFQLLGWDEPGALGKVLAVASQLVLSGSIAVLGHATMVWAQRIFAALLTAALLLVLAFSIDGVDFSASGDVNGSAAVAAFFVAAAIIASGPISYLYNSPDWVRYLPSRTPTSRVVRNVSAASGLTALALCSMGVLLASQGDMSDPVAGVEPFVPTWVFVIYILAAAGGAISNNVCTYYSSGLALQSLGLPLHRYTATAIDMVVASAIVLYILFVRDFSTALNDFVSMMIVWLGPFAGVWLADGLLRRWRYDPVAAHATSKDRGSRYWGWHGINVRGYLAFFGGVVSCLLTVNAPVFQGPLSKALGGADLSWLVGLGVGALLYVALAGRSVRADTAGDLNTTEQAAVVPAEATTTRTVL